MTKDAAHFGHTAEDWLRLPWRIHRAYDAAVTEAALDAVRAEALAWLKLCDEAPDEPAALATRKPATAPQRPPTVRAKSGKPVAAPSLDDATEQALTAAGWKRSPRVGWWRDEAGEDYPQWRAIQVMKNDAKRDAPCTCDAGQGEQGGGHARRERDV